MCSNEEKKLETLTRSLEGFNVQLLNSLIGMVVINNNMYAVNRVTSARQSRILYIRLICTSYFQLEQQDFRSNIYLAVS